ncbi:Guanylate kinase [Mesorhizobium escarrei]|uniref:Guanylate kinase n=1 Tax=Mesorhizobium escarrei TaxID=666018 RepID=A0ABM9DZM7_9HYPH|nr:Guanylate kinase [Mesorhizobium escarrei]
MAIVANHGTTLSANPTNCVGLAKSIQPLRREVMSLMQLYINLRCVCGNYNTASQAGPCLLPMWEKVDWRAAPRRLRGAGRSGR